MIRESIWINRWTILALNKESYLIMKHRTNIVLKKQNEQLTWNEKVITTCKQSNWPNTRDYSAICRAKEMIDQKERMQQQEQHSILTSSIEKGTKVWQTVNPSKLSTKDMLALTDLADDRGQIKKASNIDDQQVCWPDGKIKHTTLHKLIECKERTDEIKRLIDQLTKSTKSESKDTRDILKTALNKPRLHCKIFKLIRIAAGFNNWQSI